MNGKFVLGSDAERESLDWGSLAWMSRPGSTEAKELTVIEVTLNPGGGHNFHKHPDQEELIYVLDGEVEHTMVVTGFAADNGEPLISQKTNNRHHIRLSKSIELAKEQGRYPIVWYALKHK